MQSHRYHLIFDLDHCRETIRDPQAVEQFIRETIEGIGMRVIGGPLVCEGVPQNPGLSGFAVLDFSHISVHTFTRHNEALIDVFSCKPFDRSYVRKQTLAWFATPETSVRAQVVHWDEEDDVVEPVAFDYRTEYLREYYDELSQENLEIGLFLKEAVADTRARFPSLSILDAGCGPTLLYWIPFLWPFHEYHGLDYREDNIAFVADQVARGKAGDLPAYLLPVGSHTASWSGEEGPEGLYRRVCERVKTLTSHDLQVAWPYPDGSFHVIVSLFALECVKRQEDMAQAIAEAKRLLVSGGRFICVCLADTERWKVGPTMLRCLRVSSDDMRAFLKDAGFSNIEVQVHPAITARERGQGYEDMIFAYADR